MYIFLISIFFIILRIECEAPLNFWILALYKLFIIIIIIKLKYMKLMLTHVDSKIDDCNSATEVCKSVDLLQAIRWIAQAWESVSESTIKKCFAKAGILSGDESVVAFPADQGEFDPDSGELMQVNSLLSDTSPVSESDTPFAVEALDATSMPLTCKELSANWEEEFFSTLSASTSQNSEEDDSDDDIVKITAQPKEVKIKSMKDAMSMLEDITEYLTDENLTDMANNLSRVLFKVQSTRLAQRLNTATQTKVTDFFK